VTVQHVTWSTGSPVCEAAHAPTWSCQRCRHPGYSQALSQPCCTCCDSHLDPHHKGPIHLQHLTSIKEAQAEQEGGGKTTVEEGGRDGGAPVAGQEGCHVLEQKAAEKMGVRCQKSIAPCSLPPAKHTMLKGGLVDICREASSSLLSEARPHPRGMSHVLLTICMLVTTSVLGWTRQKPARRIAASPHPS
jgi:hypothetical protein